VSISVEIGGGELIETTCTLLQSDSIVGALLDCALFGVVLWLPKDEETRRKQFF
jgi:hypothetical protein